MESALSYRRHPHVLHHLVRAAFVAIVAAAASPAQLAAQPGATATIAVTVQDQSGAAAPGVEVTLTEAGGGRSRKAIADGSGAASFSLLAGGTYDLVAIRAGFTPSALRNVPLKNGEQLALVMTLRVATVSEQVSVTGVEGYVTTVASTGTKMDVAIADVPQSVQVVGRALLDDRAIFDFAQAATQNVSGVTRSQYDLTGAGISSAVTIRGFNLSYYSNYFRDGIKFPNYGISESGDLEQIEVLKGPASVLYGRAEPGGIVNLVTKKPVETPYYSMRITGGQYGFVRPQIDLGGPLNRNRSLRYRLNVAYEHADSFRDDVRGDRVFVAPVISWSPNAGTSIKASGQFFHDDRVTDYGLLAVNGRPDARIPISRSYGEAFSTATTTAKRANVVFQHAFNQAWRLRSAYHVDAVDFRLPLQVFPTFFEDPIDTDGRTVKRMLLPASFPEQWQYSDTSVLGSVTTGRLRHDLAVGFEAGYQKVTSSYDFYTTFYPSDLYATVAPVSRRQVDTFLATTSPDFQDRSTVRRRTVSGYVQDLITFSPSLKALVGVRFDDFLTRNTDDLAGSTSTDPSRAASPRLGLVFHPRPAVSLYASFSRSLGQTYPSLFTVAGAAFKAVRGEQYEGGVKLAGFADRLTATMAVFQLRNVNLSAPDPDHPGFSIQSGRQESRGVEFDLAARPARALNLLATYSYMDPSITSGDAFRIGNRLPNAARHTFNLWATIAAQRGGLRGFGVGGGVQAVGERFTNLANSVLLPGYARVDATAFYTLPSSGRMRYHLQFNLQNALNRRYYEAGTTFGSYIFAGTPRTAMMSFAITRQ